MKKYKKKSSKKQLRLTPILFAVFLITLALAAPTWVGNAVNYQAPEDQTYNHNLSANVTGYAGDITFAINTLQTNITWSNASGTFQVLEPAVSPWIKITNSLTGNLRINATNDGQTGFFQIPIEAKNTTDNESTTVIFRFMVNATNDAPNLTNYQLEYNLTEGQTFESYLNGTDEESHFPLLFNLSFQNNCTHAAWTGRNNGENCSLFTPSPATNQSAILNYTPTENDVGTYWAYASVSDSGEEYSCPHQYCTNSTYSINQTSQNQLIVFNILSTLSINISACNNTYLTEATPFSCEIEVRTKGQTDEFNASTKASFANGFGGSITNKSWFYANKTHTATNFSYAINVSLTPTKREVGNWSINFTVKDKNQVIETETINLFVNWTESQVSLGQLGNYTIYENTTLLLNATDQDLLIQDKTTKNENLNFATNESWVTITNTQTISGTNYSTATILINYDSIRSQGEANRTVRINVTDTGGTTSQRLFTINILNDTKAQWNETKSNLSTSNEGERVYLNLSEYVTDPDGDPLTFSHTSNNQFTSFNLTSQGIINFTTTNVDVGEHLVTINANDGKLDSYRTFNFTVYNVVDNVTLATFQSNVASEEDNLTQLSLNIYDNDFLIPQAQRNFYNESHTINLTFRNLTYVTTPINFSFELSLQVTNLSTYTANFTPTEENSGFYNVTINVTDLGGASDITYFTLNITSVNDAPNLTFIPNQTGVVDSTFSYDINATDEEDSPTLPENANLTYTLINLTTSGDFLTINLTTGYLNLSANESHVGTWVYNISVNDSQGEHDSQIFSLTIYGTPNITLPRQGTLFNWTEGEATGTTEFEVAYGIENANLTYQIYMDRIYYTNTTDYNYTRLLTSASMRNNTNYSWSSSTNFTWNYTLGYDDETYGKLKNLTLLVFNPDYPSLNHSINWKVNVTHTNQEINFTGTDIPDKGPVTAGTAITVNLSQYFQDEDYFDKYTSQLVNFTITTISGSGFVAAASSIDSSWILTLASPTATTETIQITAREYNSTNNTIGNATSNTFQVEFTAPQTTSSPSSGGGGGGSGTRTVLQYFSLKVIAPNEVEVSDQNYIDVGFIVQNTGRVALTGINLNSIVTYDGLNSEDISISLNDSYIPTLGIGQSRQFNMRIFANTQRSGRYKATIFANVTSPRFSDWGDFFINLNKVNDSEASQLLVFTEKLISENPECIELTENFQESKKLYDEEQYSEFKNVIQEIIAACEEAIIANEQIRYPFNMARDTFYYIAFLTLVLFFAGFAFYLYKRVRFNKYRVEEYIGGEHV